MASGEIDNRTMSQIGSRLPASFMFLLLTAKYLKGSELLIQDPVTKSPEKSKHQKVVIPMVVAYGKKICTHTKNILLIMGLLIHGPKNSFKVKCM